MASTNTRTLFEATQMTEAEIAQVWEKMSESPFRRVIQFELESRRDLERAALESKPADEIPKQQGVCSGLTIALNILLRPANVRHPSTQR